MFSIMMLHYKSPSQSEIFISRKCYCRIIWVCSICIWLLHLKTICRKNMAFNIHFLIHFLSNKTSLQKLLKVLKPFRFPEKITYSHKFMLVCTQTVFSKTQLHISCLLEFTLPNAILYNAVIPILVMSWLLHIALPDEGIAH